MYAIIQAAGKQFRAEKGMTLQVPLMTAEPGSTVTFEEVGRQTRVTVHDLYPSAQALEDAIASGSTEGMPEQLEQLDLLVTTLRAVA